MNATLLAADGLPRGGQLKVVAKADATAPGFSVRATGPNARVLDEVQKALQGEPSGPVDGRSIQPLLTYKLARLLNAGLTLSVAEGTIELVAG